VTNTENPDVPRTACRNGRCDALNADVDPRGDPELADGELMNGAPTPSVDAARWWRSVGPSTLRADLLAALLGALLVLPQGVAFARLAGLPPEYGIYTSLVPCVVAALFGSSLHVTSGPTNTLSLAIFAMLAPLAVVGSAEYLQLVFAT